MTVSVDTILGVIETVCPISWAEPWDNVGLLSGDSSKTVDKVFVTLDPTSGAIERARAVGASVMVTHHPLWLGEPPAPVCGPGVSGRLFEAVSSGISLVAAHTNLDRAPGAADKLVEILGLPSGEPLESGVQPIDIVTVYVPVEHLDPVRNAMLTAGAGRLGSYEDCSFEVEGVGRFLPSLDSSPIVGDSGQVSAVPEIRLEAVVAFGQGLYVAAMAESAHPYEQPLIVIEEATMTRGAARLGRVTHLPSPMPLRDLADSISERLNCVPRVWGLPDIDVETIAVATGSGGSLIGDALAAGAQVLVAGEVRYHDALDAMSEGLCIVEAGHDLTEWPLVDFLGGILRTELALQDEDIVIEAPRTRWWTP